MSINLQKGSSISLTKANNDVKLKKVAFAAGWDVGENFDLDAMALVLDANGKLLNRNSNNFVYFNNLKSADGSVRHSGDNLTGAGDGDDETIFVDLEKLPTEAAKILFFVTIYNAKERKQHFGMVKNAFGRIYDAENKKELIRYNLSEDFKSDISCIFASLNRKGDDFVFEALGTGLEQGTLEICASYGLS